MTELKKAMDEISIINEVGGSGTQNIKGKIYTKVATRVEVFRKYLGLEYGIDTQISAFGNGILCKAYVTKGEEVIGSGHAYAAGISADKSLEKLETTSVGRAMASLGLGGGEYASDLEINTWEDRYEDPRAGVNKTIANGVAPVQKTNSKELNDWWKEKLDGMQEYAKTKPGVEDFDSAWNKLQYCDKFQNLTEEQQGVLNDQYDSCRQQLQGGLA